MKVKPRFGVAVTRANVTPVGEGFDDHGPVDAVLNSTEVLFWLNSVVPMFQRFNGRIAVTAAVAAVRPADLPFNCLTAASAAASANAWASFLAI
jgi:hypothetical protein